MWVTWGRSESLATSDKEEKKVGRHFFNFFLSLENADPLRDAKPSKRPMQSMWGTMARVRSAVNGRRSSWRLARTAGRLSQTIRPPHSLLLRLRAASSISQNPVLTSKEQIDILSEMGAVSIFFSLSRASSWRWAIAKRLGEEVMLG